MSVTLLPPSLAPLARSGELTLLTQAEAARMLRCSTGKIARERRLGRLAYVPGRPVLLRLEDVLDWLDRRRVAAKTVEAKPYNPTIAARRAALRRAHNHTTKGPNHGSSITRSRTQT